MFMQKIKKGSQRIHSKHARDLGALLEKNTVDRAVIISLEKQPIKFDFSPT